MSQTIDFVSFLAERGDTRFDAFRTHYPGCPECSREVAHWSRLQASLVEHAAHPHAHPDAERMVSFASRPDSLEEPVRREISDHLEDCGACRSEVRLLQGFDLAAGVHAAASPRDAKTAGPHWHPVEALQTLAEIAGGWLREPAFAAVAATLLVAAVGWLWLSAPGERVEPGPEMRQARTPRAAPVEIAEQTAAEKAGTEALAQRRVAARPEPVAPSDSATSPPRAEPDPSVPRLAVTPQPVPEAVPAAKPVPAALPLREPLRESIQIAAHLPELPISYLAPTSPLLGTGPVRSFGVSRATGASATLELRVMAPEHVGWTADAAPTLYWRISEATDLPLEITLLDDARVEPLVEARREGPHAAGLQSLSLADLGLRLEADVVYRWQVALVVDPKRRSKDVRSAGAVVWKAPPEAPPPTTPGRAHQLATAGYWYDAFAQLSAWLDAEPDANNLAAARDALLVQVGLEPASAGRDR